MKRLLLFVLLLLAVSVVALPGAVGLLAEHGHAQAVALFAKDGAALQGNFTRGWFGSRAQHRYRIEDPQLRQVAGALTGDYRNAPWLVVDSRLQHGPLPFGTLRPAWTQARSTLRLSDGDGAEVALPGQVTSRLEPDASSHFRYRAEPGEQILHDTLRARWQEMDVDVSLNRRADQLSINGAVERFELSDGDARLSIADVAVEGTQRRNGTGLWAGTTAWRVGSFAAPGTQADQVAVATEVSSVDGQPVYRISGTIGSLKNDFVAGNDLRVDLELRNVDSASFTELLALVTEGRALEVFSPPQRDLLRRVLAGGPQLTLHDLRVPYGAADLEGTARISVVAGADLTSNDGLARSIDAQSDFALPVNLVRAFAAASTDQTRAAIELMIRLRILKPEGNRYRVTARYTNGLLNVNGFPVPVPAF